MTNEGRSRPDLAVLVARISNKESQRLGAVRWEDHDLNWKLLGIFFFFSLHFGTRMIFFFLLQGLRFPAYLGHYI